MTTRVQVRDPRGGEPTTFTSAPRRAASHRGNGESSRPGAGVQMGSTDGPSMRKALRSVSAWRMGAAGSHGRRPLTWLAPSSQACTQGAERSVSQSDPQLHRKSTATLSDPGPSAPQLRSSRGLEFGSRTL